MREINQSVPIDVTHAREEVMLPDSRLVVDVVLFVGTVPRCGIEIRYTHPRAGQLPIHWVELEALAVIEAPRLWRPIHDALRPVTCADCKAGIAEERRRTALSRRIAAWRDEAESLPIGWLLPFREPYLTAVGTCMNPNCGRRIPLFSWPGKGAGGGPPPPEPWPKTVNPQPCDVEVAGGERLWVNECVYCGEVQLDVELYGPGGVFSTCE